MQTKLVWNIICGGNGALLNGGGQLPAHREAQLEAMPAGELVFVSGHTVKTRRWVWRQGDEGKITEETGTVFFPIDGFSSINFDAVIQVRDELENIFIWSSAAGPKPLLLTVSIQARI